MRLVEYIQKLHELNAAIEEFVDIVADIGLGYFSDSDYVNILNWLHVMSSTIYHSVFLMSFTYRLAIDNTDNPDKVQERLDRLNAERRQGVLYMQYIKFEADWNPRFSGWVWPWQWGTHTRLNGAHRKIQDMIIDLSRRFMSDVKTEDLNKEDASAIDDLQQKTNIVAYPKDYGIVHKRNMESMQEFLNGL